MFKSTEEEHTLFHEILVKHSTLDPKLDIAKDVIEKNVQQSNNIDKEFKKIDQDKFSKDDAESIAVNLNKRNKIAEFYVVHSVTIEQVKQLKNFLGRTEDLILPSELSSIDEKTPFYYISKFDGVHIYEADEAKIVQKSFSRIRYPFNVMFFNRDEAMVFAKAKALEE
jgi:hypothetical protein